VADEGFRELGGTGEDGTLVLPGLRPGVALVARAPGFRPGQTRVPEKASARIVLTLEAGTTLLGRVAAPAGESLEGLAVLAWPRGQAPTPRSAAAAVAGDPRQLLARTDAGGRFRLDGVQPGRVHGLVAAGRGLFSPETVFGTPGEECVVPVLPGFGAVVKILEADGGPLLCAYSVNGVGPSFWLDEQRAHALSTRDPVVGLGGIPLELCDPRARYSSRLLLYCVDSMAGFLGPVYFKVAPPGYRRVERELLLPRIRDRLQELRIPVPAESDCWGTLEVDFIGVPPKADVADSMSGLGQLQLLGAAGTKRRFSIGVRDLHETRETFEHLPCGIYDLRFVLLSGFGMFPPYEEPALRVQITHGVRTRTSVDLSGLGSLVITARDARGHPYSGRLIVRLLRKDPRGEDFIGFYHGPYVLTCLPPGDYEICPTGQDVNVDLARRTFRIEGGMATEVVIEIP